MTVNWGELTLGGVALLALAVALIKVIEGKNKGDLATIVAAAVKAGVSEVTKPLNQGLQNNTEALQEIRVTLAEQSGKLDAVIRMSQGGVHS